MTMVLGSAAAAGVVAPADVAGPPAEAAVTLEAAVRRAVAWHPALGEAAGILAARAEEVGAARAGYLPQVTAGIGSGFDNRVSGDWRPRPQIGGSQMLVDFGKVGSAVAAARADTRAGRAELLVAVDALVRDVAHTVIEVQRARALKAVAATQLERIREISLLVTDRTDVGAATRSDALQAQARVEAAEALLTRIGADERRFASNLANLLGAGGGPAAVDPDVPAWVERGCDGPAPGWTEVPRVAAADAREERAGADLRRARADRYPTLSVGGDASTDIGRPFGDRGIYTFGLRVTGNVFGGNVTRARVRAATFAVEAGRAAAQAARLETRQRLDEASAQVAALARLAATLDAREANMRETGALYRIQYLQMGTRTLVDLLNAEQELQQVRVDQVNMTHDLRRLRIDCLFHSGRLRDAFGLAGTRVRGARL